MRYFIFSILLLSCTISLAQGVKKSDLVGKWHFAKMKTDGETMIDMSDPKVGQNTAIKTLKKKNPSATKEDEKKAVEQSKQMQEMLAKLSCTFKADGTCEETDMNTIADPNSRPKTGTYRLENNGTKLVQKYEGVSNEETVGVKLENGALTFEIKEMGMQLVYKK